MLKPGESRPTGDVAHGGNAGSHHRLLWFAMPGMAGRAALITAGGGTGAGDGERRAPQIPEAVNHPVEHRHLR